MSDTDFKIPKSLVTALKAGKVVPFVGAGASMTVKKKNVDGTKSDEFLFLSWGKFVESLLQALRDEHKPDDAEYVRLGIQQKQMNYLDALQTIKQSLGEKLWYQVFDENFDKHKDEAEDNSLKLNELIWKLSNNLIITTNVDRVFRWTCPQPSDINILDVQNVEYAELQTEQTLKRPTVFHLHGHIDHKEKVIFTREQFESFYKQKDNEAKLQTLLSFLTQRTFLFIGFSLDDDYLREILESIHNLYKGGADSFYILFRERDIPTANFPSYVTPVSFPEFGKPLEDLVAELVRIAKGDDDAGTDDPPDDKPDSPPISDPDAKKPFFNVPYNSKGAEFVGRVGKIGEIWDSLNKGGCAAIGQAVSVKGFGGLGKTQLAVEYAHAYRDKYRNGVYWLVADTTVDNQIVQIAAALGWINDYDKSVNQIEVAKTKFRGLSDCLILVDNVESFDDVEKYLPKTDSQTHLLITSREKDGRFKEIDIDLLKPNESRELLLKVSKRNPTDDVEKAELEKVLHVLDGIPLAIELVGGFLAEHENITFAKYHNYLDEYPLATLEKEFPKGSFTEHDISIIRTLRISEKTASEKPLMVEILKVLAWSGSSSMGISLLKALVEAENDFEFDTALGDAYKLRLLKKDEEDERYEIHRLLAKVIRHENLIKEQVKWRKIKIHNLIKWFRMRYFDSIFFWSFYDEVEHLDTWQEQCFDDLLFELSQLIVLQAFLPREVGDYKEAKTQYEKALKTYIHGLLHDEEFLSGLQNDLGLMCNELGEYKDALNYLLKAHSYYLREKEINHYKITTSLSNISITYANLKNPTEALNYIKEAINIGEQYIDKNSPEFATLYLNAGVQFGENGFLSVAHKYQVLSLRIFKKFYKSKHPSIADAMCNLGVSHSELGHFNKSLKYLFSGLDMFESLFGNEHPKITNFLQNIASVYSKFGKRNEAVNYYEKTLSVCRATFGEQHPKSIITAGSLINELRKFGKIEKAGRLSAEFIKFVPQNHPDWKWFEEISRPYRLQKKRHKKNRR